MGYKRNPQCSSDICMGSQRIPYKTHANHTIYLHHNLKPHDSCINEQAKEREREGETEIEERGGERTKKEREKENERKRERETFAWVLNSSCTICMCL